MEGSIDAAVEVRYCLVMERSPRSAGVRLHRSAGSMGYHTFRSFVIYLAIAIAMSKSSVSGFTIRRVQNNMEPFPDLDTAESAQLEVRYDLKGLSDLKTNIKGQSKDGREATVIAINRHKNTSALVTLASLEGDQLSDITTAKTSELNNAYNLLQLHTYMTAVPSTTETTTIDPEINQNTFNKSYFSIGVLTHKIPIKDYSNANREHFEPNIILDSEIQPAKNLNHSYIEAITMHENLKKDHKYNESNKTSEKQPNDDINASDKHSSRENLAHTISEVLTTDYVGLVSLKEVVDEIVDETTTDEENLRTKAYESIGTTTISTQLETEVTKVMLETAATEADLTTENMNTDYSTTTSLTNTTEFNIPTRVAIPWKKIYSKIDRKRTRTEVGKTTTTESDKDMTKAETLQTHVSLSFNSTPIPSLEEFRMDATEDQESSTVKLETTYATETNTNSTTDGFETDFFTPTTVTKSGTESTKFEIVSKRAGFKDNTETTSLKPGEATTSEFTPKVSVNDSELMFSAMYETEPGDVEAPSVYRVTAVESQSQLAEDAIKEELLKEETLNDNIENARHHDQRLTVSNLKHSIDRKKLTTDPDGMVSEYITEDMLSVKPLSDSQKKALYAVSPSYKPLKKIDVQPVKIFIRDPDDNTWRNESISSLGIVFKAKNASKSFTEVLKNKTESELSNMFEKGNKDDVPDLRVRLEKMAEVRKSKKKKTNNFGDTVYSDYEESDENVNLFKHYMTSPMNPSVETVLTSTTSSPHVSPTTEFDLTVNAISRENKEILKTEDTTPLTVVKPKKIYHLNEYYDSTDDYEADYINLSKIDLKKFTKPFTPIETPATRPPELLHTKPMRENFPERKATIQYFPPTQRVTPNVNLNDYDSDFNRRVNLYTFKEPTTKTFSVSYGTVSPIQTERYVEKSKVTRPPQLLMYRTEKLNKDLYLTNPTRELPNESVNDGDFNRASYVIKHYKDFIIEAAKDSDDDRGPELSFTEPPLQGVTMNDLSKMTTPKEGADEDYDYDLRFRKDIINKFVDNFNQNSERFKVNFPILYNNSVVHSQASDNGNVLAQSSAFMKRMYEVGRPRANSLSNTKTCEPPCDNMTVELSPAYELHYYVPDQEEKEEVEPRPVTLPYRYRL